MTTEELVRLIEQETARHRRPGHDPSEDHPWESCTLTIGTLFPVAGVPRRVIEEAIQQARLEGVPIITDGGVRVAQTAEEARALSGWLWGRIRSQMETAQSVEATVAQWEEREKHAVPAEQMPAATLWELVA